MAGGKMNEKIKQLAEQAEIFEKVWPELSLGRGPVLKNRCEVKKFAELIVKECIDIISPYTIRMSKPGEEYLHPIHEIKQHFGVEE
jgi:hypothetical protein